MKNAFSVGAVVLLLALSAGSRVGLGQHHEKIEMMPGALGIPVAPRGLWGKKLPQMPVEYDTAEGNRIRVVALTKALSFPWTIAFLPDGNMLVTERAGRLRIIRKGVLDPKPVDGVPAARNLGISGEPGAVHGFMDVILHPQFTQNNILYICYTKPIDDKRQTTAIARGKWDGTAVTGMKDIFVGEEGIGTARIAFGRDGKLYMTTSAAAGNSAQDPNSQSGKVLRLNDDGTIPTDNPFAGKAGHRPEIYSLGHRSSLGLAVNPATGEMWQNENGPNGGDEINVLKPGANYGWPLVSYGRSYPGPWQSEHPGHAGFEGPIVYWVPSIAVSGMAFYTGDRFPKWKGDVFVGSLRTGEIPGTGHLERILFNQKFEELRRETLLTDLRQRIRDVRQGPDGLLYLTTDMEEGAILRIEPAN
jgi:glucose/arabinose dehydrogenase